MNLFFNSEMVREMEYRGETLYSERIVAPKWYWAGKFIASFAGLVWRNFETFIDETGKEHNCRISARTAFEVAGIIYKDEIKNSKWVCRYF